LRPPFPLHLASACPTCSQIEAISLAKTTDAAREGNWIGVLSVILGRFQTVIHSMLLVIGRESSRSMRSRSPVVPDPDHGPGPASETQSSALPSRQVSPANRRKPNLRGGKKASLRNLFEAARIDPTGNLRRNERQWWSLPQDAAAQASIWSITNLRPASSFLISRGRCRRPTQRRSTPASASAATFVKAQVDPAASPFADQIRPNLVRILETLLAEAPSKAFSLWIPNRRLHAD